MRTQCPRCCAGYGILPPHLKIDAALKRLQGARSHLKKASAGKVDVLRDLEGAEIAPAQITTWLAESKRLQQQAKSALSIFSAKE